MSIDPAPLLVFSVSYPFLRTPYLSWATSEGVMLSRSFLAAISIALNILCTSIAHQPPTYDADRLVESQTLQSPYPYDFPLLQNGSNGDNGQFPMPLCNNFKLEEATIDQLQEELLSGRLTSVQIVLCYLQRIYQTDEYIR
jgi:amidase